MDGQRWVCSVCGYVHQGQEPPDCCPICGATPDLFELQVQTVSRGEQRPADRWSCLNCEYLHAGPAPPETCPVCALPASQFERCRTEKTGPRPEAPPVSVVIVGAGIAGVSAAEAIRRSSPAAQVTLLSKESILPYYRLNLTRYLAGEISAEQLLMHPEAWYLENRIELRLATELRGIDPEGKRLTLHGGEELTYDRLILAMGSHPFVPPIPGTHRENVTVLRTLQDADFILRQSRPGLPCVIIGGGVLGLETAGALVRRGLQVTLVEGYEWLMPQQLNRTAGDLLAAHAAALGISVCTGVGVKRLDGDERVHGVELENGKNLPAELVIIATGVRPNSYLVRLAHLEVNQGIVVNDTLQTTWRDIFAVGDVAEHRGVTYGTWAPAQFQGTIAGLNAVGTQTEFAGIPRSNILKVLGCDLFSIGQVHPLDGSYRWFDGQENGGYRYFLFRDSRLVGAILLGDTRLSTACKRLVENQTPCADLLDDPGIEKITSFIRTSARS